MLLVYLGLKIKLKRLYIGYFKYNLSILDSGNKKSTKLVWELVTKVLAEAIKKENSKLKVIEFFKRY